MEKKEKNSNCGCETCGCSCTNTLAWIAVILSACTLIGGAILGTCIYKKVSTIHKVSVESPYGSAENFNKLFETFMTDDYREEINKEVENQISQLKAQQEENTDSEEGSDITIPSSWETWNKVADEASQLFDLSGTPGNAIVNKKTGAYKAIGGAYPESAFLDAIEQVKAGTAVSDDMGKAGKLTKEQLNQLFDGVFFKNDNTNTDIVIIEYSDLICPYCQRHYDNKTLENIVENNKEVALVFKNMPLSFHETADFGAKGVTCAGEIGGSEAYYNFLDKAFALAEKDGKFSGKTLSAIAKELKLDVNDFTECLTK